MNVRIWWTSWSVVGRGYCRGGLRPMRGRTLRTAWYPQMRECWGPGGVLPCVEACLNLCVGGGDGPDPGHGPCGRPAALGALGQAEHRHSQVVVPSPGGDLGQGAGQGLVPRLEDAPEDLVRGGGVPYCPWGRGTSGEHGVGPLDDPLLAAGRCSGGHCVVVPALEDCTPDFWRGVVAVCSYLGERSSSGVRRLAARRAVSRVGAVRLFPLF